MEEERRMETTARVARRAKRIYIVSRSCGLAGAIFQICHAAASWRSVKQLQSEKERNISSFNVNESPLRRGCPGYYRCTRGKRVMHSFFHLLLSTRRNIFFAHSCCFISLLPFYFRYRTGRCPAWCTYRTYIRTYVQSHHRSASHVLLLLPSTI